jgi:hypothetical protein
MLHSGVAQAPQSLSKTLGATRAGALCGAPALFVSIPLGWRLKGRKGMFRRRNQQEEAQEKGSQEPGVVPWQEAAFKLLLFELVSVGIPLLLLRLINKLLTRSS